MRSAGAGAELKKILTDLAIKLGPYPHGALKVRRIQEGVRDGVQDLATMRSVIAVTWST